MEGPPRRRKKGLMIGGLCTLGGGYLFTALVGVQLMSGTATGCSNCDDVGRKLLVPVAGPWLAFSETNDDGGRALLTVLGVVQVTGLVLTIVGIAQFNESGRPQSTSGVATLPHVDLVPIRGGAYGTLGFSM